MGRPKIGEPVLIRLPADQLADIDTYARCHGVSRAEAVRRLVAKGLRRR